MKISLEENPATADLDVIERALVAHNEAKSEPRNHTPLTLFSVVMKAGLSEACGDIRSGVGYSSHNYGLPKTSVTRITVRNSWKQQSPKPKREIATPLMLIPSVFWPWTFTESAATKCSVR